MSSKTRNQVQKARMVHNSQEEKSKPSISNNDNKQPKSVTQQKKVFLQPNTINRALFDNSPKDSPKPIKKTAFPKKTTPSSLESSSTNAVDKCNTTKSTSTTKPPTLEETSSVDKSNARQTLPTIESWMTSITTPDLHTSEAITDVIPTSPSPTPTTDTTTPSPTLNTPTITTDTTTPSPTPSSVLTTITGGANPETRETPTPETPETPLSSPTSVVQRIGRQNDPEGEYSEDGRLKISTWGNV